MIVFVVSSYDTYLQASVGPLDFPPFFQLFSPLGTTLGGVSYLHQFNDGDGGTSIIYQGIGFILV